MNILIPGGCGYIGSMLVPRLLADRHNVTVLDPMWFGYGGLPEENANLRAIKGDVREHFEMACKGAEAIIYLASLSNNDACNADPELAKAVNEEAIAHVLAHARLRGVQRFIYASSVAVYGSSPSDAKESQRLAPTTLYAKAKAHCENYVRASNEKAFETVIARMASVCGCSANQRFDLTVNRMIHDAMKLGKITVNGGAQKRSHIHMTDACLAYQWLLDAPSDEVAGETFNFVAENQSVLETAKVIAEITDAEIEVRPSTDDRSYTVDGRKARDVLGFIAQKTVANAVRELKARFDGDDLGFTHYFDGAVTTWTPALG